MSRKPPPLQAGENVTTRARHTCTGGNTPAGWDCSGFTQYVYARFGIQLPHPSGMQATIGTPVTDPQPGDLMANAGHAGIYIGNGLMIHAMNPVDGTKVTAVMPGMGYYRLLG